ncbi:OmpA family protein [Chitinophaga sp. S165]|uniref:OmpA family protein n=1 Tax=Chitinophaga sp. S165 TaxID=2135462 RepID=UPI000D71A5F3|nr:OmpA family protein [Chitinophaga sp. S165]PWV56048.1 outer membrane protein OmpA-like peptidoglycan-associated protein [Chitinophaga sp. S165]
MKAILLILLIPIFVCSSFLAKAQSGLRGINYQAIARVDNQRGDVLALQAIQIKFSILDGGPDANAVYTEKHQTTTTSQGLFSLIIGAGTPELGDFSNIPWSKGNQYLKVELDKNGTNDFVPVGVMPFMAVPYALYAANGGSGGPGGGGGTVNIVWLGTLATPPALPAAGQAYYNSTDKRSYIYDSTGVGTGTWQIMAQDGLPGQSLAWLGSFTTEPSSPGVNQAYYNLTDRKAYIYDGTAWQVFSESGQNGVGTGISWLGTLATAPTDPVENQAYYNSTDKKSYIYDNTGAWQTLTQDGVSGTSGVSMSWLGTMATAPATPILNQAYYNSTDRKAYIYDSTGTWQIIAQDGTGWNLSSLEFRENGALGLTTTANADTVKSSSRAWLIRGNKDINPAIDFIGTIDDNPFIIKAGGTGPSFERIRTFPDKPQTIINGTDDAGSLMGKAVLTVFSSEVSTGIVNNNSLYPNGVVGYANSSTGGGLAGYNFTNGPGVKGSSSVGPGILGTGSTRFNRAVVGTHSSTSGGSGVEGTTNSPYKSTTNVRSAGVWGSSTHASGYGVLGVGNNLKPDMYDNPPVMGGGAMGLGTGAGVVGFAINAFNGIGVIGGGNNEVVMLPTTGAGVAGSAGGNFPGAGVFGFAKINQGVVSPGNDNRWGGAFQFGNYSASDIYTYLAGSSGGSLYGLISNGTKSTVVKDEKGENRLLFCTEAPEVLFQDFGTGELTNGSAHIDLENLLTKVIRVDAKHPMKVFIQLEGECNGVYVTNKSAKGFDVKELQGGKSSVPFTWQIVASRADEVMSDGTVQSYSDRRFPVGPGPIPVTAASTEAVDTVATVTAKPVLKAVTLKTTEKEVINKAFSNLQFSSAKADISASSLPSLDKMAALLQAHPEWQLSLSGHTDNEGTEAFNQTLSEKRSEAVKQYLVDKGVAANRITTKGYGQTKPLAVNDSKAAKGKNRRVEMDILTEEKP